MRIFIAFFRRWQALGHDTGRKIARGQRGFNGESRLVSIDWGHGAFRFLVLNRDVVEMILKTAIEIDADLIAMPTAGHHGILDAMRGSTTERVLRHAPCPVLATPAN